MPNCWAHCQLTATFMRPLWKADNDTLCNLYTFYCLLCIETFPPYSVYFLKLGLLRSGTKKIEFKTNCVSRGKNDDFFKLQNAFELAANRKQTSEQTANEKNGENQRHVPRFMWRGNLRDIRCMRSISAFSAVNITFRRNLFARFIRSALCHSRHRNPSHMKYIAVKMPSWISLSFAESG